MSRLRRRLALLALVACALALSPPASGELAGIRKLKRQTVAVQTADAYSTTFPATENPLSEGGRWRNGFTIGLDWTDFRSTTNKAFGTQTGTAPPYIDSFACLQPASGKFWASDLDLRAQVVIQNRNAWTGSHEVELWLRCTVGAHVTTAIECIFSVRLDTFHYTEVVRWYGALGTSFDGTFGRAQDNSIAFESLAKNDDGITLQDGDWVRVTLISNVIRMYYARAATPTSWQQYSTTKDISALPAAYQSGNPGLGWYENGTNGTGDYGFSSWSVQ